MQKCIINVSMSVSKHICLFQLPLLFQLLVVLGHAFFTAKMYMHGYHIVQ